MIRDQVIRILHAADIHLNQDSVDGTALKPLVDLAVRTPASLIIIAGDLFDHNRVDEPVIEFAMRELLRAHVPVVILPGNHDCLVPDSIYRRASFSEGAPNVHIIMSPEGETLVFPELDVAIWGKPICDYGGDFRPLAGIPQRGKERWQIAVAHGHYVGTQQYDESSFQITDKDILESRRDYVALGHRPTFRCIHDGAVKAYYSGSRTVAMVDLVNSVSIQVSACPLRE